MARRTTLQGANRPPLSGPTGVDHVTDTWLASGQVSRCFTADRRYPATEARLAKTPALAPGLLKALSARGVTSLYDHQVQAVEAAMAGRHVLVATPTASGKSLCFHLPVLQALADDPSATALFLYPTKALSRDQEHSLQAMIQDAGLQLPSIVFDGDTPGDVRQKARQRGRIILTNPDMLHAGILPNHNRWASFFEGLRYVVLDEMHTYRGVFGSHMAHVLTRLRRLAEFHGSRPQFIGATATIGNPRELAAGLIGVDGSELELVADSGAPRSEREVFVYNPPIVNAELGVRASTLKASVRLAGDLVDARVPSIVFAPSRNSVEVMLKYLRDRSASSLRGSQLDPSTAIMGYRGGYLPEMRRSIERNLREGKTLCVVATNALELGIDIGDLDAVICTGYPGSVAGTWQRFGRAGRRGRRSALVLVCGSGALDQYLAGDPDYLLERPAEQALIDPSNTEILIQHLKCAAFEAPFALRAPGERPAKPNAAAGETYGALAVEETRDALEYLAGHGLLHVHEDRYHWAGEAFPASHVSLRNIGWDNFVIIDQGTPEDPTERTIGELDYRATHTMLHEQAIYQQDAEQYQVERLDFDNHKAYVRKVRPDYFTTALTYRSVSILDLFEERPTRGPELANEAWGDVQVVEKVTGYKKIKFFSHENSGYGDVHLPPMEMHTTSYWLTLSEDLISSQGRPRATVIEALRSLGHALETTASLALMCDPRDINQTLGEGPSAPGLPRAPHEQPQQTGQLNHPTLFLFDAQPGGVGLSERVYQRSSELLERTAHLIARCACLDGCPACIGPIDTMPQPATTTPSSAIGRKVATLDLLGTLLVPTPTRQPVSIDDPEPTVH